MHKTWVIPDIHGCIETMRALIEEQIRPARYDELYFLGDYIDRGPQSKAVLDYLMQLQKDGYTITCLKGNHEDFMVELFDAEKQAKSAWWHEFGNRKHKAWMQIGGKETLKSFGVSHVKDVSPEYIEWMRNLTYFVNLEKFVLVHAGMNFKIEDPYQDTPSMLWVRDYDILPEKIGGRKIIHGHVPVHMELIELSIKNNFYKFIDLDNGPYISGKSGFGNLVVLEVSEMKMVIQDNRD